MASPGISPWTASPKSWQEQPFKERLAKEHQERMASMGDPLQSVPPPGHIQQ